MIHYDIIKTSWLKQLCFIVTHQRVNIKGNDSSRQAIMQDYDSSSEFMQRHYQDSSSY